MKFRFDEEAIQILSKSGFGLEIEVVEKGYEGYAEEMEKSKTPSIKRRKK